MSERAGLLDRTGVGRLVLGFILGALFGLVPIYYFYMGRDTALRPGAAPPAPPGGSESAVSSDGPPRADDGKARFASRMTYELSRIPKEPPAKPPPPPAERPDVVAQDRSSPPTKPAATPAVPPIVKQEPGPPPAKPQPAPAAPPAVVAQERRSTPAPADEGVTAARVPNARPISAMPPDPRDTTRAIEKEARMAEYRGKPATPIQGKDSREREAGRPPPPSRPIVSSAGSEGSARAPGSAEVKPILPPVSAAPARPATTATATDDIQARLGVTREWLASAAETTYTIQLLGTNNEEQLKAQLKTLSGLLDPDKIYVFRTLAQGKSSTTVLYGAYPDRRTASQAREKLPAAVAANQPVLRTVAGIRKELKQHGLAQQ